METIDPRLQQSVWQRVRGTQQPADVEGVAPSELIRWMAEAKAAWERYRRLADAGGRAGPALRRLADGQAARCRQLRGLYVLQTGQKPPQLPPTPAASGSFTEQLRAAWRTEREMSRRDADAAERWPAAAPVFSALADGAGQRSRLLCDLLGRAT